MLKASTVKIALVLLAIIVGSFFVIRWAKPPNSTSQSLPANPDTNPKNDPQKEVSEKDPPQIVSTKPDPLEEAIIGASDTIEITFNRPLENVGEFKVRIDPKVEFKLELSSDRKTGRIIPVKPYALGTGYTIFIGPESKFDGVGRWGEEKIYHFRTIKYRGI